MLAKLNQRWIHPGLGWSLWVFVFVASSVFCVAYLTRSDSLEEAPALGGDAWQYDLIAWGIASGAGFTRDPQLPEFQAPYLQADSTAQFPEVVAPVTDRPPLYPLVLAATYRAGRQFYVIRIVQAVLLGWVSAVIARRVFERAGVIPSLLCPVLLLIVDPRPRTMVREILTEDLACALVTMLFLLMMRWDRRRTWIDTLGMGMALGLLILCRTMMVLWIPILIVGMWSLTVREDRRTMLRQAVAMVAVAVAIYLPWGIHNVRILGEFRPLGTQGVEQLSAAYSDDAFASGGMWINLDQTAFFDGIEESDPVKRTLSRVQRSEQSAKQWIWQHPLRAVCLWPLRVFQEFRPHGPGDLFVLSFAVLGLVIVWPTPEGRVARWLIAAQLFSVAATWSVAGRFVFPLLGVLHLLATIGIWGAFVAIVEQRSLTRVWVLRTTALTIPRDVESTRE